jgi:hypothetical protein
LLIAKGALSAYSYLAQYRLRYFGPAFATKYLYFCGKGRVSKNALILDRNVAEWLTRSTGLRLNPVPWSKRTYETYMSNVESWAVALDVVAEDVEVCIFRDAVAGSGGQWDEDV